MHRLQSSAGPGRSFLSRPRLMWVTDARSRSRSARSLARSLSCSTDVVTVCSPGPGLSCARRGTDIHGEWDRSSRSVRGPRVSPPRQSAVCGSPGCGLSGPTRALPPSAPRGAVGEVCRGSPDAADALAARLPSVACVAGSALPPPVGERGPSRGRRRVGAALGPLAVPPGAFRVCLSGARSLRRWYRSQPPPALTPPRPPCCGGARGCAPWRVEKVVWCFGEQQHTPASLGGNERKKKGVAGEGALRCSPALAGGPLGSLAHACVALGFWPPRASPCFPKPPRRVLPRPSVSPARRSGLFGGAGAMRPR